MYHRKLLIINRVKAESPTLVKNSQLSPQGKKINAFDRRGQLTEEMNFAKVHC